METIPIHFVSTDIVSKIFADRAIQTMNFCNFVIG